MSMRLFILMGLAMVMAPSLAQAACTNNEGGVPGVAGEIEYFTADDMLRYCDGTNWIDMTDATEIRTSLGGDPNERVVFVTSTGIAMNGDGIDGDAGVTITGVPGADYRCQSLADAAGLKGTYFAWITGDDAAEEPANRFEQSTVPYVRTTGEKIADNWTDLIDGTLDNSIQVTEGGINFSSINSVFTNTATDGTQASTTNHCADFSLGTGGGVVRFADRRRVDSRWSDTTGDTVCTAGARLYCFEQGGDLVSHWKLDETAGTTAVDAMGNNDLTYLFGADPASHSETGVIGNAFNFATSAGGYGNNTTATPSIWSTGAFSVSLWLKPTEDVDSYGAAGIFEIEDFLKLQKTPGLGRLLIAQSAWTSQRSTQLISPILPTNQWTHLAVTFDYNDGFGTNPTFYINGVNETNINSFSGSGPYTVPSGNQIALGRRFDSGGTQFRGVIDDVRLYNRVLMPSEVQVLNNCTGPGTYFYNATDDVMQWCDGVNVVNNMHTPAPISNGSACGNNESGTAGVEGQIEYFTADNTFFICTQDQWVPIGRGCSNCGGNSSQKVAFVTSISERPRFLGGVSGADAFCQAQADQAGLVGDYDAWIADSDSSSAPATRFSPAVKGALPIVMPNGTQIANNWTDLTDGTIDTNFNITEFGQVRKATVEFTTTNVNANGTQFATTNTCSDWTASDGSTVKGGRYTNPTSANWTAHPTTALNCNSVIALYCFEQ